MAATKLTLSADKAIIERAKRVAAARGTSISAMVSHFLDAISRPMPTPAELGPLTRRASGLVKLPPSAGVADLMADALAAKYSKNK